MNERSPKINLDKSWARFSEQGSVKRLEGLGIKNIESAFVIDSEGDLYGNKIEDVAEIYWVKFKPPADFPNILPAEGKLYIPKGKENKTLIHYAPSFPQGNAGRFEKRYIYDFLSAKYSFFAGRHNGASLTKGDSLPEVINAPKRLEIAKECEEKHIGGTRDNGYLPSEINNQPIATISALAGAFDKINLIAQSFGASSHFNAVSKLEWHKEIVSKIHNIVSIAGYVGKDKVGPNDIWDGTKIPAQQFATYEINEIKRSDFNFKTGNIGGDIGPFMNDMRIIAQRNGAVIVPDHVGNIFLFSPNDPFIAGPRDTTPEAIKYYGPNVSRKLIISDGRMEVGDKRPHSMDWITSGDLIVAMEAIVPKGDPQYRELKQGDSFVA